MLHERDDRDIIKIDQGDIYKSIEFVRVVEFSETDVNFETMEFEYVLVLSQTCDLHREQEKVDVCNEILSVLIVPLFRVSQFMEGKHLSSIGKTCSPKKSGDIKKYQNGEHERFHVLNFHDSIKRKFELPENLIIDFRYFCTVHIKNLEKGKYIATLDDLFKERVTQRFSNYLSRIGLPVLNYPEEYIEENIVK